MLQRLQPGPMQGPSCWCPGRSKQLSRYPLQYRPVFSTEALAVTNSIRLVQLIRNAVVKMRRVLHSTDHKSIILDRRRLHYLENTVVCTTTCVGIIEPRKVVDSSWKFVWPSDLSGVSALPGVLPMSAGEDQLRVVNQKADACDSLLST